MQRILNTFLGHWTTRNKMAVKKSFPHNPLDMV
jgi:hypothetical protein